MPNLENLFKQFNNSQYEVHWSNGLATHSIKQGKYHHGDLRRAILDAAVQLITEQGVMSLTLRQVAQRVGVSPMASYRHFKNKAALLAALAQQGFELLNTHMNNALFGASADSLDRLQATGIAYVRFAVTHSTYFRVMFGPSLPNRSDYPELEQAAMRNFELLVRILVEGQQAGCIRLTDAQELTQILWSQVHGLAVLILDAQIKAENMTAVEELAYSATWTTINGLNSLSTFSDRNSKT